MTPAELYAGLILRGVTAAKAAELTDQAERMRAQMQQTWANQQAADAQQAYMRRDAGPDILEPELEPSQHLRRRDVIDVDWRDVPRSPEGAKLLEGACDSQF
jgi:hypothetical protein